MIIPPLWTKQTNMKENNGKVLAVCLNPEPGIPKHELNKIFLMAGFGVEGDYHSGKYVRHRYLVKKDATRLNNRQVLLIDTLILEKLKAVGIELKPGQMGENMILDGIDLMSQEIGTQIQIDKILLQLSENRDPCAQLNNSHPDLLRAVQPEIDGQKVLIAGVFAEILEGGWVSPGDQALLISPNK
jgi:hypothetical protein